MVPPLDVTRWRKTSGDSLDAAAKEAAPACYVEILAKHGIRVPRAKDAERALHERNTAPHSHEEAND